MGKRPDDLLAPLLGAGARLVACEISRLRARRIRAKGFPVVAQSEALPFREGAFDLVSFMEVIEHTRSPAASLDETSRVKGLRRPFHPRQTRDAGVYFCLT